MPINERKEQFSWKIERLHILSMTMGQETTKRDLQLHWGHGLMLLYYEIQLYLCFDINQPNLQKQHTVTREEKWYHQMVQQPQAGKCQLLVLHTHTCVWEAASCTVCNHSPLCQLLPEEVFASFPAHTGSFLHDRSPRLPEEKSLNHSRNLVLLPAGSYIISGKEKQVKFSFTLIP